MKKLIAIIPLLLSFTLFSQNISYDSYQRTYTDSVSFNEYTDTCYVKFFKNTLLISGRTVKTLSYPLTYIGDRINSNKFKIKYYQSGDISIEFSYNEYGHLFQIDLIYDDRVISYKIEPLKYYV